MRTVGTNIWLRALSLDCCALCSSNCVISPSSLCDLSYICGYVFSCRPMTDHSFWSGWIRGTRHARRPNRFSPTSPSSPTMRSVTWYLNGVRSIAFFYLQSRAKMKARSYKMSGMHSKSSLTRSLHRPSLSRSKQWRSFGFSPSATGPSEPS